MCDGLLMLLKQKRAVLADTPEFAIIYLPFSHARGFRMFGCLGSRRLRYLRRRQRAASLDMNSGDDVVFS